MQNDSYQPGKRRVAIHSWAHLTLTAMRDADDMDDGKRKVAAQDRTRDRAMFALQEIARQSRRPDGWHEGMLT